MGVLLGRGVKVKVEVLLGRGVKVMVAVAVLKGVRDDVGVRLKNGDAVILGVRVSVMVGGRLGVREGFTPGGKVGTAVPVGLGEAVWLGTGVGDGGWVRVAVRGKVGGGGLVRSASGFPYQALSTAIPPSKIASPIIRQPLAIFRWRIRKYGLLRPFRIILTPNRRQMMPPTPVIEKNNCWMN